jgi:hypothetical protein
MTAQPIGWPPREPPWRPKRRVSCCGRYMYWRVPLGPWCCSRCDGRRFPGERGVPDVPLVHLERWWEAMDELAARIARDAETTERRELLALFFTEPAQA